MDLIYKEGVLELVPPLCACVCSVVFDFCNPWIAARQSPLSWHFPGKNTGVGCRFLLQLPASVPQMSDVSSHASLYSLSPMSYSVSSVTPGSYLVNDY